MPFGLETSSVSSSPPPKLAVVTGAGGGLGRAMIVEFSLRGIPTVALGRSRTDLEATANLTNACRPHVLCCDVSDESSVKTAFDEIDKLGIPVGILVNNAAIYERFDFLSAAPGQFMRSVATNLGGVVHCSQAALSRMAMHGKGRIVNVATFADLNPLPCSSAYSVSKGAARLLTRALVAEVADRFPSIVITDWVPGALETKMGVRGGLSPSIAAKWGVSLALSEDPSLNGTIFDRDSEVIPPKSLKRRIFESIVLRRVRRPRKLG